MGSYPLSSQAPTPVEVELGCDNLVELEASLAPAVAEVGAVAKADQYVFLSSCTQEAENLCIFCHSNTHKHLLFLCCPALYTPEVWVESTKTT